MVLHVVLTPFLKIKVSTNLRSLNLSNKNLDDDGVISLAQSVEFRPSFVKHLNLSSNCIGDSGALALSAMLEMNTSLRQLDLSYNCIGNEGMIAIAEALKVNTTLEKLNLQSNSQDVGDESVTAIANALIFRNDETNISSLNLNGFTLGSRGALAIAKLLQRNTSLKYLYLGSLCLDCDVNPIEKEEAVIVSELRKAFMMNTTIKTFEIEGKFNVVDRIRKLYSFIQFLRSNAHCEVLDLSWRSLKDDAVITLALAIPTNRTWKSIDLSDNRITDRGTKALMAALNENSACELLNLNSNNISDSMKNALKEMQLKHPSLQIVQADFQTNTMSTVPRRIVFSKLLPFLRTQTLQGSSCNIFTSPSKNNIEDTGERILWSHNIIFENLKELVSILQVCDDNDYFDGRHSLLDTWETCLQTRRCNDFHMLLEHDWFFNERMRQLYWVNTAIARDRDEIIYHQRMQALETEAERMWTPASLQEKETIIRCGMSNLLEFLDLGYLKLGDKHVEVVANLLHCNQIIQSLYLDHNQIGNAGARALGKSFPNNTKLENLYLGYNVIQDDGILAISDGIEQLPDVRAPLQLYLNNNCFGIIGVSALARALKANKQLIKLDLSSCNIGESGATSLADALKENYMLGVLDLSNNKIGNVGVAELSQPLKHHEALFNLNLSNNQFDDKGATAIADLLRVNVRLWFLYLSSNKIRNRGAVAIAEALRENKILEYLHVHDNPIGKKGKEALQTLKSGVYVEFGEDKRQLLVTQGAIGNMSVLTDHNSIPASQCKGGLRKIVREIGSRWYSYTKKSPKRTAKEAVQATATKKKDLSDILSAMCDD